MTVPEVGSRSLRRLTMGTLGAQAAALASLSVASLLVARTTSTAVVGEYALLRVLPWLLSVTASAGLPVSCAYFLAASTDTDSRLRSTIAAMTVAGGALGSLTWLGAGVVLSRVYFPSLGRGMLALTCLLVITQLVTVTAKGCCQGAGDISGANIIIVAEELLFLPAYGVVLLMRGTGAAGVVVALLAAGLCASAVGLGRLATRGFYRGWDRPSTRLGRQVAWYGARAQVGNVLWLLNLRLDFLILGGIAGPAALGVYAVASKFAEVMRLGPIAINYVLYPRFAGLPAEEGVREARRLMPRATLIVAAGVPLVAASSVVGLPLLYGSLFDSAVLPACIIVMALAPEGAAAVSSALLWGLGKPGTNSLAMAAGLVVTVALDLLLIPSHGALGAAAASAAAYLTTSLVLVTAAARAARSVESTYNVAVASASAAGAVNAESAF